MILDAVESAFVGAKEASDGKETMTEFILLHWMRIYRKSAGDLGALCNASSYRPLRAKHYELNHTAAQCDTSNIHTSPLQTTSLMHPSTTSCNSLKIAVF